MKLTSLSLALGVLVAGGCGGDLPQQDVRLRSPEGSVLQASALEHAAEEVWADEDEGAELSGLSATIAHLDRGQVILRTDLTSKDLQPLFKAIDGEADAGEELELLMRLGQVAHEYPALAGEIVEHVSDLMGRKSARLREFALHILVRHEPDPVVRVLDVLGADDSDRVAKVVVAWLHVEQRLGRTFSRRDQLRQALRAADERFPEASRLRGLIRDVLRHPSLAL